mgnify:CR=1 FL=1
MTTADNSKSLTYRDAGVDIDAGDQLVDNIKPFAKKTMRPEVLAGIGGFGAVFGVPAEYRETVSVSGAGGVGPHTKGRSQVNPPHPTPARLASIRR